MKYFDALTRKKSYIETENISLIKKSINAKDYLDTPIEDRLEKLTLMIDEMEVKGFAAAQIEVTVNDQGDDFLDDESIFDLMSNLAVAYSRKFPKQEASVLQPKKNLLEKLPISPISTMSLTMMHVVNLPIQIVIHRVHNESDSYERVELI